VLLYQKGGSDVCLVEFDAGDGVGCRWLNVGGAIDRLTCASESEIYAHQEGREGVVHKVQLGDEGGHGGELEYAVTEGHTDEAGSGFLFASATRPPPHLAEFKDARAVLSSDYEYATVLGGGSMFRTDKGDGDLRSAVKDVAFHEDSLYLSSLREGNVLEIVDSAKHEKRSVDLGGLGGSRGKELDEMEEMMGGPEEGEGGAEEAFAMRSVTKDHVAVLSNKGNVGIYEVDESSLQRELESFREMLGLPKHAVPDGEGMKSLTLDYQSIRDGSEGESWRPPALEAPKFGQWDDKNEAHVGGSNWAGGTGGSNTAGLGGRGGPYRLDRGHKVHQVSDEAKAEVSEEAKQVAAEMARKGLEDKLREIDMSEGEVSGGTREEQRAERAQEKSGERSSERSSERSEP
jgi:hypothetical protein